MPLKTRPFDSARYLRTDAARAFFMTEALETNDPSFIAHALDVIARSRLPQPEVPFDDSVAARLSDVSQVDLGRLIATMRDLGLTLTAKPA